MTTSERPAPLQQMAEGGTEQSAPAGMKERVRERIEQQGRRRAARLPIKTLLIFAPAVAVAAGATHHLVKRVWHAPETQERHERQAPERSTAVRPSAARRGLPEGPKKVATPAWAAPERRRPPWAREPEAGSKALGKEKVAMRSSALDPANAQRRQASPKRRVIPVVPKAAAAQARRGPKAPDALAAQVARYEQARALSATDPTAALAAYRAILNRWPKGVLAHEVELAILALHAKLGQREALRRAAAAFSRRYPTSPKRREVMRLLRRKK